MRFTKEEFCTAIDNLEEMCRQERKIFDTLQLSGEWVLDEWISNYYELIRDMCDIEEDNSLDDLSYYCGELDFGKKWRPGCITMDGEDIPCRNAEELWELMNRDFD